jgi:hypothetical protein
MMKNYFLIMKRSVTLPFGLPPRGAFATGGERRRGA